MSGTGATFVNDVVGAGLSRGREETGVKRLSWTPVGGVSMVSIGTRRVRGFGEGGAGRAGFERFERSNASASTFRSSSLMGGLSGSNLRARRRS